MQLNLWGWVIVILIILGVFAFWAAFLYLSVNTIEFFDSRRGTHNRASMNSRTAFLFNASPYSGMFSRRFTVPAFHSRTHTTSPLHNTQIGTHKIKKMRTIWAPWGNNNIYPLTNRRLILV